MRADRWAGGGRGASEATLAPQPNNTVVPTQERTEVEGEWALLSCHNKMPPCTSLPGKGRGQEGGRQRAPCSLSPRNKEQPTGPRKGLEIGTFPILSKETSLLWGSVMSRFPQGTKPGRL